MGGANDIIRALNEHGPMKFGEVVKKTGMLSNSVRGRLYDLRKGDSPKVTRDVDGLYSAHVTLPAALDSPNGRAEDDVPPEDERAVDVPGSQSKVAKEPLRQPLSGDQEKFKALLKDCDVKKGLDTITETVFAGDPEDLEYVLQCLEDARAFVQPLSRKLILRHWAKFTHRTLPPELEERMSGDGTPSGSKQEEHPLEELGLGWQVQKDKDGEWGPQPNGDLTYREALKMAATMNVTSPRRREAEADEDSPRGRAGSFQQELMIRLLDRTFDDNGKRGSPDDDRLRKLEDELARNREELAAERERAANERMQRLESMVATALTADPVEKLLAMREKLAVFDGPTQPMVTDPSPTVQLIKDSSDKLDKGMNRVAGVLERVMLRQQDEYVPEQHSSDDEREERAGELANRMEQSDRSRDLRKDVFGK